jgi:hemoglobin
MLFASVAAQAGDAPTLYEALGGQPVIERVVNQTVEKSATDPVTKRSFDKVNLTNLKKKLVEQICEIAAGPCKYSGDTMKLSHKGLDITEAEFYGLVEHLRESLNAAGVSEGAKNQLLRLLAPMKRDIVTH